MLSNLINKAKALVAPVLNWASTHEPVVVANAAAAAVAAFVQENQGDLHGTHAWVGVLWAALALAQRHFVTPAKK